MCEPILQLPTSLIPHHQCWLAQPGLSVDLPEQPPPPTSPPLPPLPPLLPELQLRRPRPSSSMERELLFAGAAGHDGSVHARGQAMQRQRRDVRLL